LHYPTGVAKLGGYHFAKQVPRGSYLLADKAKNPPAQQHNGRSITIDLPESLPDPNVSVVVVEK